MKLRFLAYYFVVTTILFALLNSILFQPHEPGIVQFRATDQNSAVALGKYLNQHPELRIHKDLRRSLYILGHDRRKIKIHLLLTSRLNPR